MKDALGVAASRLREARESIEAARAVLTEIQQLELAGEAKAVGSSLSCLLGLVSERYGEAVKQDAIREAIEGEPHVQQIPLRRARASK